MPGACRTRSLVCEMKKAYERSHHRFAETFRHSLHDGVTVSFVLSPVNRAFCHRRLSIISTSLTPASGRQDHTTSPSEVHALRLQRKPRPSHPAPNVRDDRDTPLFSGARRRACRNDLPVGARVFFGESAGEAGSSPHLTPNGACRSNGQLNHGHGQMPDAMRLAILRSQALRQRLPPPT